MNAKFIIVSIASIFCFSLVGCGTLSPAKTNNTTYEPPVYTYEVMPTNTEEPVIGKFELRNDTKNFLFGKWKVKKLLGFCNSWNDASEYPNGQDIIGNELIIQPDMYSSLGLEKYKNYQEYYINPYYYVYSTFNDTTTFYRQWKLEIPEFHNNDNLEVIKIAPNPNEMASAVLFCINNDRLIFELEATIFELEKTE